MIELPILHLLIIGSLFLVVFLSIILVLFFKYSNLKTASTIAVEDYIELKNDNIRLYSERDVHIKKIEQLATSLNMQEEIQNEALKNSKSVLYDLSNSLVNQLLELHKQETDEARKQSEEKIAKSTESFNGELQKVASLVTMLTKDMRDSKDLVDNLKNALLSPSATGALAEVTLENLLKNSGLKQDIDFMLQYSFSGGEQNKLRPDAVVFLPENNLLIIDAKSSQFLLSPDSDVELVKAMQTHLKNLTSKDYTSELSQNYSKKNIKFGRVSTIMFVPTEHAIEKMSKLDPGFVQKAWKDNIYPVGPSGLMNILSIARLHIGERLRVDNYEQIISEINSLISSIAVLSEHGARLGSNIASIVSSYDKFAASFNRNLISKVKNLKTLGTGQQIKQSRLLERYQVVSSKNDLIEADPAEHGELSIDTNIAS